MQSLNREQALQLTPAQLEERAQQKVAEDAALRATLRANAVLNVKLLPKDERGVPFVAIPLDDPDAWRTLMFHSQRLRDRGDQEGRVHLGHVAHAAEMGYWKP